MDEVVDSAARSLIIGPLDAFDEWEYFDRVEKSPGIPTPREVTWYHVSPTDLPLGTRLAPMRGKTPWNDNPYEGGLGNRANWIWVEHDPIKAREWMKWVLQHQPNCYLYKVAPRLGPWPWNGSACEGWVTDSADVVEKIPVSHHTAAGQLSLFPQPEKVPRPRLPKPPEAPPGGPKGVQMPISEGLGDFRWSDMLPINRMYDALMRKYNDSTDEVRQWGSEWYDSANQYIKNLAQKTNRSEEQVAAVMAAFSPRTAWDPNMAQATHFLLHYDPENPEAFDTSRWPGLGENLERAKRILAGPGDHESVLSALQGAGKDAPKITSFYKNMMGDEDAVTIDAWMARAILGEGPEMAPSDISGKMLSWAGSYEAMSEAVRRAAKDLGISPRALQAIVWTHVNPTADYEEWTPETFQKKERQKQKQWEKRPPGKSVPDYTKGPAWDAQNEQGDYILPQPTYKSAPGYNRTADVYIPALPEIRYVAALPLVEAEKEGECTCWEGRVLSAHAAHYVGTRLLAALNPPAPVSEGRPETSWELADPPQPTLDLGLPHEIAFGDYKVPVDRQPQKLYREIGLDLRHPDADAIRHHLYGTELEVDQSQWPENYNPPYWFVPERDHIPGMPKNKEMDVRNLTDVDVAHHILDYLSSEKPFKAPEDSLGKHWSVDPQPHGWADEDQFGLGKYLLPVRLTADWMGFDEDFNRTDTGGENEGEQEITLLPGAPVKITQVHFRHPQTGEWHPLLSEGYDHPTLHRHAHRTASGCTCWEGYERVPGTKPCADGSCRKKSGQRYRPEYSLGGRKAARPPQSREARRIAEVINVPEGPHELDLYGPVQDGNGRWVFPHQSVDPDTGTHRWSVDPASYPAVHDSLVHGRPHRIFYDPERVTIEQGDYRPRVVLPAGAMAELPEDLDPTMIWRGMSEEEYQEAKERGYFESRGSRNLDESQVGKTFFTTRPSSATSYANSYAPYQFVPTFDRPAHVIGIPDRPDVPRGAMGEDPKSHEVGVPGRIPFSDVKAHWIGNVVSIMPGVFKGTINPDLDGPPSRSLSPQAQVIWEADPQFAPHTAHRTAGANGDLPPDMTITRKEYPRTNESSWHAYHDGQEIASLWVMPSDYSDKGAIADVTVHDAYLRRGVATALWNAAGRPAHTPGKQSGPGKAWALSVGGDQDLSNLEDEDDDSWFYTAHRTAMPQVDAYDPNAERLDDYIPPERVTKSDASSWYHVSPYRLPVGTTIRPGGGPSPWAGYGKGLPTERQNWVWMDSREQTEDWHQALLAAMVGTGEEQPWAYVYEVAPEEGPFFWNGTGSEGMVSPSATIVAEIPTDKYNRISWPEPRKTGRRRVALELNEEEAEAFEDYIRNHKIRFRLKDPEPVKGIPMTEFDKLFAPMQPSGTWYHVSPHDLPDGTVLVPGGPEGKATSQDFYDMGFGDDSGTLQDMGGGRTQHVWVTPDRDDANFWAAALGAPHIYEVEPDDDPQPWNGTGSDGWVTRGGRIRRRITDEPESSEETK